MQTIPISAVPSQSLQVTLGTQNCKINIYTLSTGMFLDLFVNNDPILTGIICRDRLKLIRLAYLGFIGDLAFIDTEGTDDPVYTGLGTRFLLVYLP